MSILFNAQAADKINHGSAAALDNIATGTFIGWFYLSSVSNPSNDAGLFGKGSYNTIGIALYRPWSSGAQIYFRIARATLPQYARSNAGILTTGWNFLAGTWNTGISWPTQGAYIYRGTLSATVADITFANDGGSGAQTDDSGYNLVVGNIDGSASRSNDGRVAFFALYNRVMTLKEIASHQFKPFPANGCLLFTHYGFNGLNTQPDWSGNANAGTVTNGTVAAHVPLIMPFGINNYRAYTVAGGGGYTEDLTSTIISITSVSDLQIFLESLLSTITSLSSLTEAQAYLEAVQTQISSVSAVSEAQIFVESLQTIAVSVSSISELQTYIETVITTIQSAATLQEAQTYIETLSTTIVSVSSVIDTIGGFTEDLQTVITSVSAVDEIQTFFESLQTVIQSSSSATEIQNFVEQINTTILSISTAEDRQLFIENIAIIALSQSSVVEIMSYIEQVQTVAVGTGSVTDFLVGSFVGNYIIGSTVAARSFVSTVAARSFVSTVAAR